VKIYCRACRALLPPDAKFCQACGAPLLDRAVVVEESCVACGASLASTAKFCRSCGAAVASATAATPVTPAKEHFVASVAPPALPQRDAAHSLPPVALVAAPEQAKRQPQRAPPAAATQKQARGKLLLGIAFIAGATFFVWQWFEPTDQSAPTRSSPYAIQSDRQTHAGTPQAPLNTDGIEGIVDIDAPDSALDLPTGIVSDAAAKLPELMAQSRAGNARAMTTLALTQRVGLTGQADPLAAIALLQRAVTAGDADAMVALADEYESGVWIDQDARKAKSLREQAAKAGSRLAQWELEL